MPTLNISVQRVVSGTVNDIVRWTAAIDDTGFHAKAKTKEEAIGELILKNQSYLGLAIVERQTRFARKDRKGRLIDHA